MNATASEPEELSHDRRESGDEDRSPSVWLWIVSAILLLTIAPFFALHRHAAVPTPSAISGVNTLPQLGVVQFDAGKPTLTPDGQATLDRAADVMHGNPNVHLRLEGYDSPSAKAKKHDHPRDPLAMQRALSVQLYLDARGVERSRIMGGRITHTATGEPIIFPEPNVDSRRAELYVQ